MTFILMEKVMSKKGTTKVESKYLYVDLEGLKSKLKDDKIGLGLVARAIFMQETLRDLENKIETQGTVVEMCQGTYSIDRINPALQAYNGLIKNFTSIMKQINDLMPAEEPEEDEFDTFE